MCYEVKIFKKTLKNVDSLFCESRIHSLHYMPTFVQENNFYRVFVRVAYNISLQLNVFYCNRSTHPCYEQQQELTEL